MMMNQIICSPILEPLEAAYRLAGSVVLVRRPLVVILQLITVARHCEAKTSSREAEMGNAGKHIGY